MRGADTFTENLFTLRKLEDFVPADHPLRSIRKMANAALAKMDRLFAGMYEADIKGGRPSIAPEKLLRAMLLQVLYSVRSERQLMEQVQYTLRFRCFIGLSMDDAVWVPTVFTKNRERLIKHDAVIEFFNEVVGIAENKCWLSGEHFSVDGTLIQAWAGHKSFVPKASPDDEDTPADEPPAPNDNWHGQKRSNQTPQSTTDEQARLFRKSKGTGAMLCYMGHVLTDNRHGLVVNAQVTLATGTAERDAAGQMLADAARVAPRAITVGADKNYDTAGFVASCRANRVTPHVAQNAGRPGGSAIDERTTRWPGYAVSQQKRKRIEQVF